MLQTFTPSDARCLRVSTPARGCAGAAAGPTWNTRRQREASVLSAAEEGELLRRGLVGSPPEAGALVRYLAPVVQVRVGRALACSAGGSRRRNLREEVEDMSQEVFTTLFADDAKVLRAWSPERGLSLRNFVGMVARRKTNGLLGVRKRNPWYEQPMDDAAVERALPEAADAESRVVAKQVMAEAMRRTAAAQSERGRLMLQLMIRDGKSNPEVVEATGLKLDAVYQWRSRLTRVLRQHLEELMDEDPGTGGLR